MARLLGHSVKVTSDMRLIKSVTLLMPNVYVLWRILKSLGGSIRLARRHDYAGVIGCEEDPPLF